MKRVAYAQCIVLAVLATAYDGFVFLMKDCNHTCTEVRQIAYAGLASGIVAAAIGLVTRRREWALAAVLGVVLFARVYGMERAGIMMYYDDWLHAGMPDRPW